MPKIVNRFSPTKTDAEPENSETAADRFKRLLGWKPAHELHQTDAKT